MKTSILLFLTLIILNLNAQEIHSSKWEYKFGGSYDEKFADLCPTADGGYLIAGSSNSNDGQATGNYGGYDFWVVKTDQNGKLEWKKNYGGSKNDNLYRIAAVDDGYILCGSTMSSDHDVTINNGNSDAWLIKISETGMVEWQISVGQNKEDKALDMAIDYYGNIIAVGSSFQDSTGADFFIFKVDNNGELLWTRTIPGDHTEHATSICKVEQENFIIAGYSDYSHQRSIIHKIDQNGNDIWIQEYKVGYAVIPRKILLLADGNYMITGGCAPNSYSNYWLMRTDLNGIVLKDTTLGGSGHEYISDVIENTNGTLTAIGYSNSTNGSVMCDEEYKCWVVTLNNNFNILDQYCVSNFRESNIKFLNSSYGDLVLAGTSTNSDYFIKNSCQTTQVSAYIYDSTYCPPGHLVASDGFDTYKWIYNINDSIGNEPILDIYFQGKFKVIAYNMFDCPSSFTIDAPAPLFTPFKVDLCVGTVDEQSGKVKLKFYTARPQSVMDSIYVYRVNEVGMTDTIAVLPIDQEEYIDLDSHPEQQSYFYNISNLDTCGTHDWGSSCKTLLCQASLGINGEINLFWTEYQGFQYMTQEIYRSINNQPYEKIGQIAWGFYNYTDVNPPQGLKKYQIRITRPAPCAPWRNENEQVCSNVIDLSHLGNSEFAEYNFSVYPIPAENHIKLKLDKVPFYGLKYYIANSLGTIIKSGEVNGQVSEIEISSLRSGIYTLYIGNSKTKAIRLIKI